MSTREDLEHALEREHARQIDLTPRHDRAELRNEHRIEREILDRMDPDLPDLITYLRRGDASDLIALIRAGWDPDAIEQWARERFG